MDLDDVAGLAGDDVPGLSRAISTVAVAGATGFVGRSLTRHLSPDHHLIGLGRAASAAETPETQRQGVTWRRCDLFSLLDAERALAGAEVGVYLVHSMLPTSRLTQGRFQDLDLICADNFARAAARQGVRRIVYLGGLVPAVHDESRLSPHLRSRLEVERALAAHGVPLVALRASMVIGAGGSSFEMMARLVERLPAMICPAWTETATQPIALDDVVRLLTFAIDDPDLQPGSYDVGGPDVVSYRRLMEMTAERLGLRRRMLGVPLFSPGLSRLWVSVFSGAPRALVAPLVQSLRHPMVASNRRLQTYAGVPGTPLVGAIDAALAGRRRAPRAARPFQRRPTRSMPSLARPAGDVRSVQRLALPDGHDARWIADEYLRWIPERLRFLLRVEVTRAPGDSRPPPSRCLFRLRFMRRPLLELRYSPERSTSDRPLFYVTGGVLAHREPSHGRLEFREIAERGVAIAALHDYVPRLPFGIYLATQGLVHRLVMGAFARHLRRLSHGT
jgi:uncharacterized protein YbjT (DUF2867 family)